MSRTYLLDANTASYIIKGRSPQARRKFLRAVVENEVCISALTEAELRYGLAKRQVSVEMQTAVEEFLAKIEVLPWESAAARAYTRARVTLERIGKPLANMDLLIAAHAASLGAVLVTNDHTLKACSKHIDVRQMANWADDVGVKS